MTGVGRQGFDADAPSRAVAATTRQRVEARANPGLSLSRFTRPSYFTLVLGDSFRVFAENTRVQS